MGAPVAENFEVVEAEVREPQDGEIVVANRFMSVDPYMRGRMNDVKSYVPPFQIGEPLDGGAVGEVIESNSPDIAVGDHVVHGLGWREIAVMPASQTQPRCAGRRGLALGEPRCARDAGHDRLRGAPGRRIVSGGRSRVCVGRSRCCRSHWSASSPS